MKIVAVSEHYFPRVGGTVNYVHETLSALVANGVDAELWVPGPAPETVFPEKRERPKYKVVWIDADYPKKGDPNRAQRYSFCRLVDKRAQALSTTMERPTAFHVLFGLFLMETLNTHFIQSQGVACVATVHNVPPHECRKVAPNAAFWRRVKESARLRIVGWKNESRLKKHNYDKYIVPSAQVRDLLAGVLPGKDIQVIGHGPTSSLLKLMNPPTLRAPEWKKKIRLLTAGGYAPHKRQHLIPAIADRLRAGGLEFEWDVVGPSGRIAGYQPSIANEVLTRNLSDYVRIRDAIPTHELAALYDAAHLYVQPSIEEGYCITALDAAAAGLPVIASPAGALAEISRLSHGELVASEPAAIANAIFGFVTERRWRESSLQAANVQQACSWQRAATTLQQSVQSIALNGQVKRE